MKKKLYRIGNSKEPTPEILKRIASNLTTKTGLYSSIEVDTFSILTKSKKQKTKIKYGIYLEKGFPSGSDYYDTWPEFLKRYRKLMREAKDVK